MLLEYTVETSTNGITNNGKATFRALDGENNIINLLCDIGRSTGLFIGEETVSKGWSVITQQNTNRLLFTRKDGTNQLPEKNTLVLDHATSRIGINILNPTEALDIEGNIKLTGNKIIMKNINDGDILVSKNNSLLPVTMSGVINISNDGTTSFTDDIIENKHLKQNIISNENIRSDAAIDITKTKLKVDASQMTLINNKININDVYVTKEGDSIING